jgi:competence protein ComK
MDSIANIKNYIVTKHTFLLESKQHGKKLHTIIHDQRGTFEVAMSPLRVIKNSCKAYGSNYRFSQENSKELLTRLQKHKLPIVVGSDFGKPLILFPIFSPSAKHNMWIVYNNVISMSTHSVNVAVILKNSEEYDLPINKNTLVQQIASSGILHNLVQKQWQDNLRLF